MAGRNTAEAERASIDVHVHMAAPILLPHEQTGAGRAGFLTPEQATVIEIGTNVCDGTLFKCTGSITADCVAAPAGPPVGPFLWAIRQIRTGPCAPGRMPECTQNITCPRPS